jgi:hypothetical protein
MGASSWLRHYSTMANILFRCPATGLNVQHQLDDDTDVSGEEYEAVRCLLCTKVHLINRRTGELLNTFMRFRAASAR